MVREIIHDEAFLSLPSVRATIADLQVAADLLDTLKANADRCVGMAANMIGVSKRIIAFNDGGKYTVMFNPAIVSAGGRYTAVEGCLSVSGQHTAERYSEIRVRYKDEGFSIGEQVYTGFTAQIIQHEIDHLNGRLI